MSAIGEMRVALSNLEWLFTIGHHDVCLVACIDRPGDLPTIAHMGRYIDDLLVVPFWKRTGVDNQSSPHTEIEITEYTEPLDMDRLLKDATAWLASLRKDRTVLTGMYAVRGGFEGVAHQLRADGCRAVVVMMASHAIIDGISLPALSKKVEKAAASAPGDDAGAGNFKARYGGMARGVLDTLRYSARALTTRDRPFDPVFLVGDVPRDSLIGAAGAIGIGSEALCYALVLHLVGSDRKAPHWVDRAGKAIIAFRPGALRPEYEPFLRLGFDRIRVHAGLDLAETARQVSRELERNKKTQDQAFVAGQTVIGITRQVARVVGDKIGTYILDRVNSESMTFSFYPLKPGALVPDDINIVGATAYSLADRGIMTIIQILDDSVRFSIAVDAQIAERLGDFEANLNRCCDPFVAAAADRRAGDTLAVAS